MQRKEWGRKLGGEKSMHGYELILSIFTMFEGMATHNLQSLFK